MSIFAQFVQAMHRCIDGSFKEAAPKPVNPSSEYNAGHNRGYALGYNDALMDLRLELTKQSKTTFSSE